MVGREVVAQISVRIGEVEKAWLDRKMAKYGGSQSSEVRRLIRDAADRERDSERGGA
jgi:hypothetical protein